MRYIVRKKSWLIIGVLLAATLGVYYFANHIKETPFIPTKQLSVAEAKDVLEKVYAGVSGFGIPDHEVKFIKKAGGAPTYGEIKFESAQKLLDYFKLTEKDVFYDLGSGVGKFVLHAYLTTPVKKSCGIELSGTRYERAVQAFLQAKKMRLFDSRELIFLNQDIIRSDLKDATIIFMCATCYSDVLMDKIAEKLIEIGSTVRIATLREFKNQPRLKKIDTLKLPMTWSEASPVYIYVVESEKK
jgi:SAM-dependent methyltransferase